MKYMILLSLLLVHSAIAADYKDKCPQGCSCDESSLSFICNGLSAFPDFPEMEVSSLHIQSSSFPKVPANAFNRLSSLFSIIISDSDVGSIENCAFNLLDLDNFTIYRSHINIIKSGAFRNITLTDKMELNNVTIQTIDSYAFYGIYRGANNHSVGFNASVEVTNANIREVKPAAFHDVYLEYFTISGSVITHIHTSAVLEFRMRYIDIHDTFFERMDCGTFNHGGGDFYSAKMDVICNCRIAWMIAENLVVDYKFTKCRGPGHLSGRYLIDLNITQVCPTGLYTPGCPLAEYDPPDVCPPVEEYRGKAHTTQATSGGVVNNLGIPIVLEFAGVMFMLLM